MSDEGFSTYMEYLRSNVFTETSVPEGLADIVKAIKQRAGLERKPDSAGREPVTDQSGDSTRQIPTIGAAHTTTIADKFLSGVLLLWCIMSWFCSV